MKHLILLFILLLNSNIVNSQIVCGSVVDCYTKKVLHNANIVIKSKNIGTTTNKKGEFIIKCNPKDSILISYIGYKTEIMTAENLANTRKIYLVPQTTELSMFSTHKLSPENIVRLAYHSINQNYDTNICLLQSKLIYKKYKNNEMFFFGIFNLDIITSLCYPSFVEEGEVMRAVLISGEEHLNNKLNINTSKKSIDSLRSALTLNLSIKNALTTLIELNRPQQLPYFLQPQHQKHYNYFITTEDTNTFIISFSPKNKIGKFKESGNININKYDFSIIEFSYKTPVKIYAGKIPIGYYGDYEYTTSYNKINNLYYLYKATHKFNSDNCSLKSLKNQTHEISITINKTANSHHEEIKKENCIPWDTYIEELSAKYSNSVLKIK